MCVYVSMYLCVSDCLSVYPCLSVNVYYVEGGGGVYRCVTVGFCGSDWPCVCRSFFAIQMRFFSVFFYEILLKFLLLLFF